MPKFTLTFKTPDVDMQLDKEQMQDADVKSVFNKYIKYGEVVNIEFDTETKTATVLES